MGDGRASWVWIMRAVYVWLAVTIVFLLLLPLETVPRRWAPPDYLIALTFAWAMRRPEYVPALAIGGVALFADLMLQRPPGLLAALIVVFADILARRAQQARDMPYLLEWLSVAGAVIAVMLSYRLLMVFFFLPAPPFGMSVIQAALTIAVYPLVALASHFLMGVRRPAPGEVDALGHRL